MLEEIKMVFPDVKLLVLTGAMLLIGLAIAKDNRKPYFIPAIIITMIIVNPLFYDLWYKFVDRAYWRMLWIIPVITVCAFVPAYIINKVKKSLFQSLTIIIGIVVILLCGNLVYRDAAFVEATNVDKLPDDVVNVAEALLNIDAEPYVVADGSISRYLRQYSGKIKTMFARDIDWVVETKQASVAYSNLYDDLSVLSQVMLNYDYDYLVTNNTSITRRKEIEDTGFELVEQVGDYGIYQTNGLKNEIREYNKLHQVTSVAYVNQEGLLCNNQFGYALIKNEYNDLCQMISTTYLNDRNELVNNEYGYARIEYEYPQGYIKPLDYYYDSEGRLLERGHGFLHSFLRQLNKDNHIIFISVYDEASSQLSNTIVKDMRELGIKTNLKNKYGYSYYAIISPDCIDEKASKDPITSEGSIGDVHYKIESCGGNKRTGSSIVINDVEYSPNIRGLNIVVYDLTTDLIEDAIAFDTYESEIMTYRKQID